MQPDTPDSTDSTPKKRNKREENREKSKELILRASLELFACKGYGSTTMEMIADRAGISRGLPYLYFESKDKILHTLMERHFRREKETIHSIAHDYNSQEEFVHSIVKRFMNPFLDGSESDACLEMRLFMNMMLLPETKSIIQDYVTRFQCEVMQEYFQSISENFAKFGLNSANKEIEFLRLLFFGFTFCKLCMGEEFSSEDMMERIQNDYLHRIQRNTGNKE